ncbi:MAG: type IX secretion system membrane protein PorP/SprF [Chitinophagales bacterium]|nr:type IX secretion system membrane protein PorP/SprF [Chitinophagales bacterium]MDW8417956.1 type IX secretion system membrane protein PorP/SprF [Chitinophagales bacterium]
MNKILYLVMLAGWGVASLAQNEPVIAHFVYHGHVFNPAVSGNARDIYLGALYRQQWIGFREAPGTLLVNAHGYIPKAYGGVGLVITNDMLGKQRFTTVRGSYAYAQRLNDRARISLGLSIGMFNAFVKGTELIYQTLPYSMDQSAVLTNTNRFKVFLATGVEFSGYNATVGFAVNNLDQGIGRATPFRVPRHYFTYARYDWDINERLRFTPAVFVRFIEFIAQAEANMLFTIRKRILLGALYRSTDAAGLILGGYITKNLLASYAYDFGFGELRKHQTGSHEIQLQYRISLPKPKPVFIKSPRYVQG